jgi:type IV pilus assembly protein PilC
MCPLFDYIAENKAGEVLNGRRRADTPLKIAQELKNEGYYIKTIKKINNAENNNKTVRTKKIFTRKLKLADLIIFTEQFKVMIKSGIPLLESLQIIKDQVEKQRLKNIIEYIHQHVEKGGSLSEGLEEYPELFPKLYCQLIRAGEKVGILETVLEDLALHYKTQHRFKKEVKGALYYPLIVMITAVVAIVFIVTYVVPGFVDIFNQLETQLPLTTQIVLSISIYLKNNILKILLIIILQSFLIITFFKTNKGKYYYDRVILKVPFIGKIKNRSIVIRLCSTLSLLLANGLNLLEALAIVEKVMNNTLIKQIITKARVQVREGKYLSEVFYKSDKFPGLMLKMLKAGERAGALPEMLQTVSEYYEEEVKKALETGVSMIEPVLIIVLALVVGFIAVSVILPMFNMYSVFS